MNLINDSYFQILQGKTLTISKSLSGFISYLKKKTNKQSLKSSTRLRQQAG
jgi:hypothetical protein